MDQSKTKSSVHGTTKAKMESQFPTTPGDFCLRVLDGPDVGKVYQLAGRTVVGRHPQEADVFMGSPLIARRHFILLWDEDSCRHFIDNGWLRPQVPVYVNDRPIGEGERIPLTTEDLIRVAETTFVYEQLSR